MPTKPNILLVEDNPTLGYALREYLQMQELEVTLCEDGMVAQKIFQQQAFDLCIIDVMLPKQDGFALARHIKSTQPDMPVIFLTAKSMKVDKLKGFQIGADDYIIKPVDEEELVARIRAVLRRSDPKIPVNEVDQLGIYRIHWQSRSLVWGNQKAQLTEKEMKLLRLLFEKKNSLLDRSITLKKLWGKSDYFNRRSMDVHIARLRKYLRHDPKLQIINVHGKGFILEENG
ncbi:response regulator transcription factor [Catalinimonas sp. 4WD22]|uniref:response regulator transcription factor n=1 Tax=Catalinimonas locisalis TaxID=3133978 RepID=UPI003100D3A4